MNIDLKLPRGWQFLSPSQLEYTFRLLAADFQHDRLVTACFLNFTGLRLISCKDPDPLFESPDPQSRSWIRSRFPWVDKALPGARLLFNMPLEEFVHHLSALDYLKTLPTVPVRLPAAVSYGAPLPSVRPVSAFFYGVDFEHFLAADALYTRILFKSSGGKIDFSSDSFVRLLKILYPGIRRTLCTPLMCVCAIYWMAGLKSQLTVMYPDLFGQGAIETAGRAQSLYNPGRAAFESKLRESINAQIRALTQGDITRRDRILATDTHTALAELDAIAREAAKLQTMPGK